MTVRVLQCVYSFTIALLLHITALLHADPTGTFGNSVPRTKRRTQAFPGERAAWDSQSYYQVITDTAEHYSKSCASNIRASFGLLAREGKTSAGRARLADWFSLCAVPTDEYAVSMLAYFMRDAFDTLAMGNYPFEYDSGHAIMLCTPGRASLTATCDSYNMVPTSGPITSLELRPARCRRGPSSWPATRSSTRPSQRARSVRKRHSCELKSDIHRS